MNSTDQQDQQPSPTTPAQVQPGQSVQPAQPPAADPESQPPAPAATKPVILLAEDDTLLSRMYKTKFEKEGFQIVTAEDGETALKIALEQKIDLIILDIMMPKLSGIDMLRRLREDPRGQNIPVIVLSNLTQQKEAQEALQLGAKEYLIKANLIPSQIIAKVRQYLGKV